MSPTATRSQSGAVSRVTIEPVVREISPFYGVIFLVLMLVTYIPSISLCAQDQPWHPDFPSPEASFRGRRLNSLAFNITAVDCTRDLCPFEVAQGTQWDRWDGNEMFPPRSLYRRYEARAEIKLPQMGDMSARTASMIHRGRTNFTTRRRPVLVLGVDAPNATNPLRHDVQFTRRYYNENLSAAEAQHFTCRVVDELEPIIQAHDIEELRA
jgi:hypothetical protein